VTNTRIVSALMLALTLLCTIPASGQLKGSVLNQNLWNAAAAGNLATVLSDIRLGAGVNWPSPNEGGAPALEPAARNGHLDVVQALVAAGANVNQTDTIRRKTPLLAASFGSQDAVVNYLLTVPGIDVNWHALNDWTPALDASWVGDLNIVQALVAHGADVTTPNKYGETPLQAAELALGNCYTSPGPLKVCPVSQGNSKATQAQYETLVAYLESLN
jgi:ankyrin repeat protein